MPRRLVLPLLVLLAAVAGIRFFNGAFREPVTRDIVAGGKPESRARSLFEYLCGGVGGVQLGRQFLDLAARPGAQVWEGLAYMDRHIADHRLSEAMAVRQRAEDLVRVHASVSGLNPDQLEDVGPGSMVSQHADIVTSEGAAPILDPDPNRARRRLLAGEILAAFWEGRIDEGKAKSLGLSPLSLDKLQVAEVMAGLRLRAVSVTEGVQLQDLESAKAWYELTREFPSPLVQGERAMLASALLLRGHIPPDKVALCCRDGLEGARKALLGESPQTDELLRVVFEMIPWSEQPEQWAREATRVARRLGISVSVELFGAAHERLRSLDPEEASAWVRELLTQVPEGPLKSRVLRSRAVDATNGKNPPLDVFKYFNEALKASPPSLPRPRADLLVDLAIYEKELDATTNDPEHGYLKRSAERLREAVRLVPSHESARMNLATLSLRGQNPADAKAWMEGVDPLRLGRSSRAVWHWIQGQIALADKRVSEAKNHATSARELDPQLKGLHILDTEIKAAGG